MTRRYDIVTDPANSNALALIDHHHKDEIVERGIVAEGGRTAWAVAKAVRDAMNGAGGHEEAA